MDSFTIDKLRKMKALMDTFPPPPVLATWVHFTPDSAVTFKYEGRDYVGAHPDFWKHFPATPGPPSLADIKVIDLALPRYGHEKAIFLRVMRRATLDLLEDSNADAP